MLSVNLWIYLFEILIHLTMKDLTMALVHLTMFRYIWFLMCVSGFYYELDDSYDESDEEEVRTHLRKVTEQPPLKLDQSQEVAYPVSFHSHFIQSCCSCLWTYCDSFLVFVEIELSGCVWADHSFSAGRTIREKEEEKEENDERA